MYRAGSGDGSTLPELARLAVDRSHLMADDAPFLFPIVIGDVSDAAARVPDGWDRLAKDGLLGDNNNIVHGNDLTDAQLKFMLDKGVTFSLTPETEMFQGHGFAITGRLRKLGAQPSLGVDLESCVGGDMFTVARMAMISARRSALSVLGRRVESMMPSTRKCTFFCACM